MYDTTKPYTKRIVELVETTHNTPYLEFDGKYFVKRFHYPDYSHVDGIGTKGVYHWRKKSFRNAVIDAMAMNLNDLAFERAVPYAITDHIFIPEDDHKAIISIVEYLAEECRKREIAITGGETAIHTNTDSLEISIVMSGFVKKPKPNKMHLNDVLIGIASNGLHSNGFTKVWETFGNEYRIEFIESTFIYSDLVLELNEMFDIHGMMHITGGAYTKLKPLLEGSNVVLQKHSLKPQKIFFDLCKKSISDEEMYKTFNCGVGFVLSADKKDVENILKNINEFRADVIGKVVKGSGNIVINSMFSGKEIVL